MPALDGRLVVVTRAVHQSAGFVRLLESMGARVVHFPVIEIAPPSDWAAVDAVVARLDEYQWLIFTSANAVDSFFDRAGSFAGRIAAVGPATARALQSRGLAVDLIPADHIAEGLIALFASQKLSGVRILLPRAASARDVLPEALRAQGAMVDIVDVYRNTVPASCGDFPSDADWITFTSASTVKNLLALVEREHFASAKFASIGPETSAALRGHQLPVTVEASPSTQEGLAEAIAAWENSRR